MAILTVAAYLAIEPPAVALQLANHVPDLQGRPSGPSAPSGNRNDAMANGSRWRSCAGCPRPRRRPGNPGPRPPVRRGSPAAGEWRSVGRGSRPQHFRRLRTGDTAQTNTRTTTAATRSADLVLNATNGPDDESRGGRFHDPSPCGPRGRAGVTQRERSRDGPQGRARTQRQRRTGAALDGSGIGRRPHGDRPARRAGHTRLVGGPQPGLYTKRPPHRRQGGRFGHLGLVLG